MANLVNPAHLIKANSLKPLQNFPAVMGSLKNSDRLDILGELPNTHGCDLCGIQVALSCYVMSRGKRFCSDVCADMNIERNPREFETDGVDAEYWED